MNLDKLEKNIYHCKFFEVQLIYNIVYFNYVLIYSKKKKNQ